MPSAPRRFRRAAAALLGALLAAATVRTPAAAAERAAPDLAERTSATLLGAGETDLVLFANAYTQTRYFDADGVARDAGGRTTYGSLTASWTRDGGARTDWGMDLALRTVRDATAPRRDPPPETDRRTALSWVAPRVEFAPWSRRPVSLEASVRIPLARHLDGTDADDADARPEAPYLDSGDPTVVARLRGELGRGGATYWYGEAGAELRVDRHGPDGAVTPLTAIWHVRPAPRWTLYVPLTVTPAWGGSATGDWSSQVGLGAKLRPAGGLELESVITFFPAGRNQGAGAALGLGARWVR